MEFAEQIIYILIRGLAIGVLISAPMGPIGILVIQRTLNKGRWVGFFTGIGAATSDLIYSLLTGLGMSFITDFIETNQNIIQVLGSIVLLAFGVFQYRNNPVKSLRTPDKSKKTYTQDAVSGFFLTFSNPLILFFIIGLFARLNFLLPEFNAIHYSVGYITIFAGALLWWFGITFFVNKVRGHFNLRSIWLINRVTSVIILGMSALGLVMGIANYINI